MKNFKKLIVVSVLCTAVLALLTACGKPELADENWRADKDGHWHETIDGGRADEEAHKLVDDLCEVCNSRIDVFENGETWLTRYNDHNDMVAWYMYEPDGTVSSDWTCEYVYDEDGGYVSDTQYENGRVIMEDLYTSVYDEEYDETFSYVSQTTVFNEDGSRVVERYDQNGDMVAEQTYDAAGALVSDYIVKHIYNENGELTAIEKYDGETLAENTVYEYNEDGVQTGERSYRNGVLVKEYVFVVEDGWSYASSLIEYHEDGTQTVTEYDEDDMIVG